MKLDGTMSAIRRTRVVAHRGASGYEPENTFAAFDLAIKQGADMLELDVHLTKDDVPIILHDDTLQRTTDGTGRIRQKSFSEIKTLNAAAKVENHQFEAIPTLEQILEKYRDQAMLMLEIKHGSRIYNGIEQEVISTIKQFDAVDRCELISFDFDCVRRVRAICRDVLTGIIFVGNIPEFTALAREIGCNALHPSHEYTTAEDVSHVREIEKLTVYSWVVNELEDVRQQCYEVRPDGIVTDYPSIVLEEVKKAQGGNRTVKG